MPTPNSTQPPSVRPPRLAFLTVPLLAALFVNAIELLLLPFQGQQTIADSQALVAQLLGQKLPPLTNGEIQTMLWVMFAVTALIILWLYFTRRALLEGRRWGRVSAIVIGVLSLLILPIGTVLGVVMLIGAFDRDVTSYASR